MHGRKFLILTRLLMISIALTWGITPSLFALGNADGQAIAISLAVAAS